MTQEPIYEFKRGEGWVIQGGIHITTKCGKNVRLEMRQPTSHERYMAYYKGDYKEDHDFQTMFADRAKRKWLTDFPVRYHLDENDPSYTYCTVVPVD